MRSNSFSVRLPGVVVDDHGVDDLDDGPAVRFGKTFEGPEAAMELGADELGARDRIAGEQVINAGGEGVESLTSISASGVVRPLS